MTALPSNAPADVQAERGLLRVERDVFWLEMRRVQSEMRRAQSEARNAERAVDELRAKLRDRAGALTAAQKAQIQRNLADTGHGLEWMVGLYRTAAAIGSDTAALRELSEFVDPMTQRELVGFLLAAVQRLAGEAS